MTNRVIFMGGKNIGCAVLDYLINDAPDTEVVAIFVNPMSDIERDRWHNSAMEIGIWHNIPVHAMIDINKAPNLVRAYDPDLIVVTYYDQILSDEIISIPSIGAVNLHTALSEEYRGCYSSTWAIINGEERTGVTLHWIDEGIDTGDIIAQIAVPIAEDDTGKSLYMKCQKKGVDLFRKVYPNIIQDTAYGRKQVTTEKTKYYKRKFPSHDITEHVNKEALRWIRALTFDPFPAPYVMIGGHKYKIVEVDGD